MSDWIPAFAGMTAEVAGTMVEAVETTAEAWGRRRRRGDDGGGVGMTAKAAGTTVEAVETAAETWG